MVSNVYGGSGLGRHFLLLIVKGLTISKHLVRLMGGDMRVISQKGKGSTFAFVVVCKRASVVCKESAHFGSGRHPINQKIMSKYLEQLGHSCEVANNGLKGLNLAKYPFEGFLQYMYRRSDVFDFAARLVSF